jgi:hypothetical protein
MVLKKQGDGVLQEEATGLHLPSEAAAGAAEDIIFFRATGFDVDDDNDPAPENITVKGETVLDAQTWGWNGICYRKLTGLADHPAKMIGCNDVDLKNIV